MKNEFRHGSQRTLSQSKDAQAYDNMVEVAGMLTSTSYNNWAYEVEDCYLDFGQKWMWTTIICYGNGGDMHQVLNPAEWVQICNAESEEELKQIVDEIKSDKYFQDRDRSKKESFDDEEFEDEEEQYYDWYEDYEDHPLLSAYETACDELNIWPEGSTQGTAGVILFYDNETDETKYRVEFEDEIEFMNSLDHKDDERSNIDAIKAFISSHKDIEESAEGDQIAQDYIDSKNANYEADKQTTRDMRTELAKQGIATDEEGKPFTEDIEIPDGVEDAGTSQFGDRQFKYKGFTIAHFPYDMKYDDKTDHFESFIIESPATLSNGYHLPLYCEDENGEVVNFLSLEAAKMWIDNFKDRFKLEVKHGNEIHAVIKSEEIDESYGDKEQEFTFNVHYKNGEIEKKTIKATDYHSAVKEIMKDKEVDSIDDLKESFEDEKELVNGYKVFKAESNGRWFVFDGSGYKCDAKGYETKEEAIERAKSLEQGKATSLEENIEEPIKETDELKASLIEAIRLAMEDLRYVNIDSYDSLDYFVNDVLDLLDKYDTTGEYDEFDTIISHTNLEQYEDGVSIHHVRNVVMNGLIRLYKELTK